MLRIFRDIRTGALPTDELSDFAADLALDLLGRAFWPLVAFVAGFAGGFAVSLMVR